MTSSPSRMVRVSWTAIVFLIPAMGGPEAGAGEQPQAAARPIIEPVIPRVIGSVVSTLEGRRITRLKYELRFEGTKPLEFTLPQGQSLKRVYLNGSAVPFETEAGHLKLEVTPTRTGDAAGNLELVLSELTGSYHLSGRHRYRLPAASWTVNELQLELHLPQVFNYTWRGGSLAPSESRQLPRFTYAIPTPGKHLAYRQSLIMSSTPDVVVDYTVDLSGQYFRLP